jgi:hypothetical protein
MEKLYAEYGNLMIQMEIIQAKINDVKGRIVRSFEKQKEPNSMEAPNVAPVCCERV